jgi:hypothetical protein
MIKKRKQPFRIKYFYIPNKVARNKAFNFLAEHLTDNIQPPQKEKIKKRMRNLILKNKWIGQIVFNLKTGESEWKMKRNQKIKEYFEPLKGEHLHTPRRNWRKGFKRLANNLAVDNKQIRKRARKEKSKMKNK